MKFLRPLAQAILASTVLVHKPTTSPSLTDLVTQIHTSTTGGKGAISIFWTNKIPQSTVFVFALDDPSVGGLGLATSDHCTYWNNGISNIDDYQVDSKLSPSEARKFNTNYSAALGKAAKGVAYVITNPKDDAYKKVPGKQDTHWLLDEFPMLQRNSDVTEVFQIWEDPTTYAWVHTKIWPGGEWLPPSKAA